MNVNPFYSDFKRKKIFNIDKPTQLKILGQHRINAKNRIIQWVPNKNCE